MRIVRIIVATAIATVLCAGCAQAVDGTGTGSGPTGFPATSTPAPPVSTPVSTPVAPPTSLSGGPATGPATVSAASLHGRLMPLPAGSTAWQSSWGRDETPTIDEFVGEEYDPSVRADVTARLHAQGLTTIVHRAWYAQDTDQADVVLLRFATTSGAMSRYLSATSTEQIATGSRGFHVSSVPSALGFKIPHLDRLGNAQAIIYVPVRNVVVEMFYFSAGSYQPADAVRWLTMQYQRLR